MRKSRLLTVGAVIITATITVLVAIIQRTNLRRDSGVDYLAAELRARLTVWYSEKGTYPETLDEIWSQPGLMDVMSHYTNLRGKMDRFQFKGSGNTYELSFTNFGGLTIQRGSNGVATVMRRI